MTTFTLFPAIDLRRGRVVRLERGDPARETVFGYDAATTAAEWAAAGAQWLHVVNLDGALGAPDAAIWRILPSLARCGARLQFGGGLRTLKDVEQALAAGVTRVVLGTVAVEKPALVAEAVSRFGPTHVAVALDARDGMVQTRGWRRGGAVSALALGRRVRQLGVETAIHTDISRDGLLAGVNVQASAALAKATGLEVIASGGVASLDDIRQAAGYAAQGVGGVIVGRALYDSHFDLPAALRTVEESRC